MNQSWGHLLVALLPVIVFLIALILLDSFRLVRPRLVAFCALSGIAAALLAYLVSSWLLVLTSWPLDLFSRYAAPWIEEGLKAVPIVLLIGKNRIGFLVDAAIYGFAVGTGFALAENYYYLALHPEAGAAVWVVRGVGTALLHGGLTAVIAILSRSLVRHEEVHLGRALLPGLVLAVACHSFYNHFVIGPLAQAALVSLTLPWLVWAVFLKSDLLLRDWLGVSFDSDVQLLRLLESGDLARSDIGAYLQLQTRHLPGPVVADMLCCLRLRVELSLRAKGVLMMRQAGFKPTIDQETRQRMVELRFVEKSIGKTGRLAILPFVHQRARDLWQLHLLD